MSFPVESESFVATQAVTNGIERITYTPRTRRYKAPILLQHGMWHGAWCWSFWQKRLAILGWESHAISLPGHGASPMRRPTSLCTLGYYERFLQAQIDLMPQKPILVGHSMGGALVQRILKRRQGSIAAAVTISSWPSQSLLVSHTATVFRSDPLGLILACLTLNGRRLVRNPEAAAEKLITENALYTADELHARLGEASGLVLLQHNPPFWSPAAQIDVPFMWMAAEKDAVMSVKSSRASAGYYGADFYVARNTAHNVMVEKTHLETSQQLHEWMAALPEAGIIPANEVETTPKKTATTAQAV